MKWRGWRARGRAANTQRVETPLPASRTSSEWVVGWKIANLLVMPQGKIGFSPIRQYGIVTAYGIDATAECASMPSHKAPEATHQCGFNAFHDQAGAARYWDQAVNRPDVWYVTDNLVMLRVGLWGRVQEGTHPDGVTWGYKASRQRVANVFVSPYCQADNCTDEAVALGVLAKEPGRPLPQTSYLRPMCKLHVPFSTRKALALPQLIEQTGVDFRWDNSLPV